MVQNVFLLDERPLTSIMRPRGEIEWLEASDTVVQAVAKAGASGHSWYPVCRGGLDDVVGVVKIAGLLSTGPAARGTRWPAGAARHAVAAGRAVTATCGG